MTTFSKVTHTSEESDCQTCGREINLGAWIIRDESCETFCSHVCESHKREAFSLAMERDRLERKLQLLDLGPRKGFLRASR